MRSTWQTTVSVLRVQIPPRPTPNTRAGSLPTPRRVFLNGGRHGQQDFVRKPQESAAANGRNEAGGRAYKFAPKHALAQLAATGCFNGTYYATAETQLDELRKLIDQVDDNVFLAKLAVYARERAFMKDMPAALLAVLSKRDSQLMHKVFDRVVDNGRVLRTLFQMIRSGQFGRTSLSSSLQRAFQRWLNEASVGTLLSASIGDKPSLRDVLRLARPTPKDNARRALFGWLTGKEVEKWAPATEADLPEQVQGLVAYRKAESAEAQALILGNLSVRWDLLADAAQGPLVWKAIAHQMGPQALRMNLNTLLRHEVFSNGTKDSAMVDYVAGRIADAARDPPLAAVPVPVPGRVPECGRERAAEDQGGAASGGRDRLRKRAGVAGPGPDRPGHFGFDGRSGHGQPGPGCDQQDAVRGRRGIVRRGHPAPEPGQRCGPVRHGGVRGEGRSAGHDSESGGAAGQVRWRWHGLLAAAGPGQRQVRQAAVCRRGAGQRQRELGLRRPCVRRTVSRAPRA